MSEFAGAHRARRRSFVELCTICTLALVAIAGLLQRTFNNFSVGPVYVATLALAIPASALVVGLLNGARIHPRTLASLPFVMFGAASILFNANPEATSRSLVQDSILWSFAIVAAGVAVLAHQSDQHFERSTRFLLGIGLVASVYGLLATVAGQFVPISVKSADLAILVSVLLPISIANIARLRPAALRDRGSAAGYATLALALVTLIALSSSRSTMLVGLGALVISIAVLRLRPSSVIVVLGAVFAVGVLFAASSIDLEVRGRSISPDGLVVLVRSMFVDSGDRTLDGTLDYRSEWWSAVVDDAQSTSIWVGSGPGHDLREFSRVPTSSPYPHNGFVTVFSHMGLIGLVLFLAPLLMALGRLRRLQRAARSRGDADALVFTASVAVVLWGSVVNLSIDVFVESPHGALIYWTAIGAALGTPLPRFRGPPGPHGPLGRDGAARSDAEPGPPEPEQPPGTGDNDETTRATFIGQGDPVSLRGSGEQTGGARSRQETRWTRSCESASGAAPG